MVSNEKKGDSMSVDILQALIFTTSATKTLLRHQNNNNIVINKVTSRCLPLCMHRSLKQPNGFWCYFFNCWSDSRGRFISINVYNMHNVVEKSIAPVRIRGDCLYYYVWCSRQKKRIDALRHFQGCRNRSLKDQPYSHLR
jgi:hypothetical protein